MSDYVLSCCTAADLSQEYLKNRDIPYLCYHFEVDGEDYLDDMGQTLPLEELFKKMDAGADTKTSQIAISEYTEFFESVLSEGKDLIHLTLSSGITGSYNSAMIAKEAVQEKYPDRKLYVVDSLAASSGYGLLVDELADLRDEGMSIDDLYSWVENNKTKLNHWFFTSDLTYFIRGGRVSKTAGAVGQVLSICPLLNVDFEGRLIPREKIRTKKKVIRRTVEKMEELADDGIDYSGKVFISNSACPEDAKLVSDLIEEKFTKMNGMVRHFPIGATIGSHTGPGTVALFFWGKERLD